MLLVSLTIFLFTLSTSWSFPEDEIEIFEETKEFCYSDPECGPKSKSWSGICQNGTRQSPIALPNYGPILPGSTHLHLNSYRGNSFRMRNNGHTVQVELISTPESTNGSKPIGLSRYRYEGYEPIDNRLDSAYFHWGAEDGIGSEHEFEGGRRFSMELHLVHYRSNYTSTTAALKSTDENALAVIGIMLNVTVNQQGTGSNGNSHLTPITQSLATVKHPSSQWTYVSEPLDFTTFLPSVGQNYMHTYKGSLTTPTCDEKVNWHVFRKPVPISQEDVQQFRSLENHSGENLKENHRPLQPRHDRTVFLTLTTSA